MKTGIAKRKAIRLLLMMCSGQRQDQNIIFFANIFQFRLAYETKSILNQEAMGKAIKTTAQLKTTPLVMLTSRGMRGDSAKMKKIGFAAYLIKPVNPEQLLKAIEKFVKQPDQ